MRTASGQQQSTIEALFPGRARFDLRERRLYAHDVGAMPTLIQPLVGNTIPAGIVQPHDEAELINLVDWARRERIPLVPRGKGTSGYGGVLATHGGLVVEFNRMRRIVAWDVPNQIVTVEPGIVWQALDGEMKKHGLTLRTYPTSYPSSTVGGWLAQGGAGIGGFEYGWFRDNVISARVVLLSGEVREFNTDSLDLIADAEGTTGFISEVTLRLRRQSADLSLCAEFENPEALQWVVEQCVARQLPLWSISFINPTMARLKNQVPQKHLHDEPRRDRFDLPERYLATFTYPDDQDVDIVLKLDAIVQEAGGQVLSAEMAAHEWNDKFNLMNVKRLGPSLVPAEVVVPARNLAKALDEIECAVNQPFAAEGMVVLGSMHEPEVVLLGFIPHDQRTFQFNLAFALSLTVLRVAQFNGGRAYSTGLYFQHEAENVLGPERLSELREFKRASDPDNLMNPGKVIGGGVLGQAMRLAEFFEPFERPFANAARSPLGERFEGERNHIPADVSRYAYACAQCGFCVDDCTEYSSRGWESTSPRGKWYFLREVIEGREHFDQRAVDNFLICTTCERCNVACPLGLPVEESWLTLRGKEIHEEKKMTFPPFEIMAASAHQQNNIWASYARDRANWITPDVKAKLKDKADYVYFAGCTASFVENDVAQGSTKLLAAASVEFATLGTDESCCGIPMLVAGRWDVFEEILRHNLAEMKKRNAKTVVTSCPACWLSWHSVYPDWAKKLGLEFNYEVKHYSQLIADKINAGEFRFEKQVPMRVTWHDSCHIGRAGGVYEPPRTLLRAIPGVEFVEREHNRQNALCCGSVLTLIGDPKVAHEIGDKRIAEAQAAGADAILSLCPCCEFQLRVSADKMGEKTEIHDLSWFAAKALGAELVDATPHALTMWALFEKMVFLMKPKPMADLMGELMPEMIEAMPRPFPTMMRSMRHAPVPVVDAMMGMMKFAATPMFQRMMPGMMPKVMPAMLEAVENKIPMPPHMREQMPDLMPAAMNNLMPNLLPEIVPHLLPHMREWLLAERTANDRDAR